MAKITEMDVKAQMIRDKRTHRIKEIAPHSIVVLENSRVGYLETNTGGKPWVVVDPGELAVEVDEHDRLEVLVTPRELALDWMAQPDVCDAFTYGDATRDLLAAAKLALSNCEQITEHLSWRVDLYGARDVAKLLRRIIARFERTRK